MEEAVGRIYIEGEFFTNFSTASRCLAQRAQRVPHFHGASRYGKWRTAFRHVITFRRKCRAAKRTDLMPGPRPHGPMQQVHGLRPFLQYNPRGAFRTSAAKIGVHRRPPRYPAIIGGHALIPTNKMGRLPGSLESASAPPHFTISRILFNTVEHLGRGERLRIG